MTPLEIRNKSKGNLNVIICAKRLVDRAGSKANEEVVFVIGIVDIELGPVKASVRRFQHKSHIQPHHIGRVRIHDPLQLQIIRTLIHSFIHLSNQDH